MSKRFRPAAGALVLAAMCLALGCGGGPKFCDVKGKVVYDGKPLPGGTIQITDDMDTQMVATDLNIDGEFKVGRAPAGPVRVVVRTESVRTLLDPRIAKQLQAKGVAAVAPDPKEKGNKYVPIPAKYADRGSTDLRYDLRANTLNELTVELKK